MIPGPPNACGSREGPPLSERAQFPECVRGEGGRWRKGRKEGSSGGRPTFSHKNGERGRGGGRRLPRGTSLTTFLPFFEVTVHFFYGGRSVELATESFLNQTSVKRSSGFEF